ncbi:MAG: tetratricopeptide repeat protein [Lachnospiraceae bacterium]|nr:tetratricopeptide repeat protein [Lachnospiraceae bacterium]
MDINSVLTGLDQLFQEKKIQEVEPYLNQQLNLAKEQQDNGAVLTILNEQIGYYRSISRRTESIQAFEQAKECVKSMGLSGTEHEATTLLNGATALRAAERYQDAMEEYRKVEEIYGNSIEKNDYRFASLYNNMSLLYTALEQYEDAAECLKKALVVLQNLENSQIEQAITYTNLALNYSKTEDKEARSEALASALHLFEIYAHNKDAHYAAALSGLAGAYYETGDMIQAAKTYQMVCEDIRSYFGENMSYAISLENLAVVYRTMGDMDQAEILMNQAERIRGELQ